MRNYVKRINQKKDKLSKDQLLLLIDDVIEENDVLNSIINSLSTGILIVDKDFKLLRHNTASESRLPYKIYPEEIENAQESLWNFIDDEEKMRLYYFNFHVFDMNKDKIEGIDTDELFLHKPLFNNMSILGKEV